MSINKTVALRIGLIFVVILSIEFILEFLMETVELIVDAVLHGFTMLYEDVLGIQGFEAERRAGWTTVVFFTLLLLLAYRLIKPVAMRKYAEYKLRFATWWASLQWFEKLACGCVGVTLLAGMVMVI